MSYIAKADPLFQGIGLSIGIASGVAGILSFGYQLYFSSSQPLSEEQITAILEKINTENSKNLKVEITNELTEKLEIWDASTQEKITKQEEELRLIKQQRNTIAVALGAVVLFVLFVKRKD